MILKVSEKILPTAIHQLDLTRGDLSGFLQDGENQGLGDGAPDSDAEKASFLDLGVAGYTHQFIPETKDFLRVILHHAAGLGQNETFTFPQEEWSPQGSLQFGELGADGGLTHPHLAGGACDAAFGGDRKKMTQVVVVER